MHEMSLAISIVELVSEKAQAAGARKITAIELEVGRLSGLMVEGLAFCFEAVARNTLAECKSHGADKAEKAIRSAIANGWQGLVWERHAEPRGSRGPQEGARPRYPAYQVATATLGLSPEDISTF